MKEKNNVVSNLLICVTQSSGGHCEGVTEKGCFNLYDYSLVLP